jgi:hypothetical protein
MGFVFNGSRLPLKTPPGMLTPRLKENLSLVKPSPRIRYILSELMRVRQDNRTFFCDVAGPASTAFTHVASGFNRRVYAHQNVPTPPIAHFFTITSMSDSG